MGLSLLEDTSSGWPRMPYSFQLGKEFESMHEALTYVLEHEIMMHERAGGSTAKEAFAKLLESGDDKANPKWFTRPYFASTEPGGNDAINCYPQFNEDDDIVHPITRAQDGDIDDGLGRVYSEMIEANQQILWMTFGVAEFNNPVSFYGKAIDVGLAKLMRVGEGSIADIGSVVGSFVGFVVSLPFQPLIWLDKLFNWNKYTSVTKYYDFKQTMLLYYEFANTIMTHFTVNTGMVGILNKDNKMGNTYENDPGGGRIPKFMSKYGPDLFAIMSTRARRADIETNVKQLQDAIQETSGWRGWWNTFISKFGPTTMGAADYIGFRIEKSVDSSETFTNQSGESSIASTLNGQASSNIDMDTSSMGISGGVKGALASALDALSMGGGAATLMGAAFIDIPEIWKGSSFGKSYSVSLKLVAHYGDTVTIAQSIMLPLSLLMAGALPRATGPNSYTSPFLCRCYCKGRFAIPLGLIENMTITRGDSEFGWNKDNLPTVVTVNLTIKDLSPAMYIALGSGGFMEIFGQNSSFQEYLLTLSGAGLQERILWTKQITRKFDIWASIRGQTGLFGALIGHGSPSYWSMRTANLGLFRTVGAFRRSLSPTN